MKRSVWYSVRSVLVGILVFSFMPSVSAQGKGATFYFVRHMQTVANKTRDYSGENQECFTKRGMEEMYQLIDKLTEVSFDAIYVSPVYRARETIIPYLKETEQVATIWPEMAECCWRNDRDVPASEPLNMGALIELEEHHADFFRFRDDNSRRYYDDQTFADGMEQLKKGFALLKEWHSQTGETVLIVAHGLSIGYTLRLFLAEEVDFAYHIDNARINIVRENEDGTFQLLVHNDEVVGAYE